MNRRNKSQRNVALGTEWSNRQTALYDGSGELSEADQRYRWLLEISSEAVMLHSGGRFVLVNHAAVKLFGAASPEQLIGKPVLDFIQPQVAQEPILLLATPSPGIPFFKRTLIRLDRSVIDAAIVENPCRYLDQPSVQLVIRHTPDRRWIESRLINLAQYDLLTELPNRSQFLSQLGGATARATRNRQLVGVIFLALDHFKQVNTTLGHQAGDMVLKLVAERLKQCVRKGDTVARLGGDEFSMILEGIVEKQGAAVMAQRTLQALSRPLLLDNQEIQVTVSMGITVYPLDADNLDGLLHNADAAMCYAKQCGRNDYQLYSPELDARNRPEQLLRTETESRFARLTPREREVLEMLIAGKSNKMIAYLLGASSRTIENHRAKIMDKMQAESLPELVRMVLVLRGA
jgi:diguanylate cyclase (GGDEF)-like protein/PAS domain S-box-containing protein